MEERIFTSKRHKDEYLNYWYHCDSKEDKCPLVIYIHGAGNRGTYLTQMNQQSKVLGEINKGRILNAITVVPQCHKDTWFELYEVLLEFIDTMRQDAMIDSSRVYLIGSSMGGYTVWQLAMSRPEWFAALVAICGGGMYWNAKRLIDMPIWAFHGVLDKTVLPEETIHMVDAVNQSGGNARITLFSDVAHNAWERALGCDETWDWIFGQKREG